MRRTVENAVVLLVRGYERLNFLPDRRIESEGPSQEGASFTGIAGEGSLNKLFDLIPSVSGYKAPPASGAGQWRP
jgi:hypothetical protein